MRRLFIVLSVFFCTISVFGNGAIIISSPVMGTGDPVFVSMPDVQLISEKLQFKLNYEYTDVKVKYILWNNSDKDYKSLDYGFPMDYTELQDPNDFVDLWRYPYLKDISFKLDGKPLDFTDRSEDILKEGERALCRKWHFTKISIPKRSFISLEVNYSVLNGYVQDGFPPLFLDLDGYSGFLAYDFSPASHWGDGIIRDFYVEVDATEVSMSGMGLGGSYYFISGQEDVYEGLEQKNFYNQAFDFEKQGNVYTYRTRNFDLKKAKPLYLSYSYCNELKNVLSKKINGDKYSVATSIETTKYPKSNLSDMNLETAWVAPNGGIGEWIEFTFKEKEFYSTGFTLVNGYIKNETMYKENNRIKKILIQVKNRQQEGYNEGIVMELEDIAYEPVFFENLVCHSYWIDAYSYANDYEEDLEKVEKLKITILEVYPGTKYNDTCISEILLYK